MHKKIIYLNQGIFRQPEFSVTRSYKLQKIPGVTDQLLTVKQDFESRTT